MTALPPVLIVEDTLDIANIIMISLERLGLESYHASTGQKAVAYLEQQLPDLIMLDLNLPGMNGWQVLDFAKEQYGEENLRVIVITASTDASNRLIGKLQIVARYVTKPFHPEHLLDVVREVLALD